MNAVSRLVTVSGHDLPLQATHVEAHAHLGVARVLVRQVFHNPTATPAEVVYQLPLPADAAVSGFVFTIAGRRVLSRIAEVADARRQFAEAVIEGRAAGLIEQVRDGLFLQRLGNVPPGATVHAEIEFDQPLHFVDGAWEWRLPTVVTPRFVDEAVTDAVKLAVDVSDNPLPARLSLSLTLADELTGPVTSPSHSLCVEDVVVRLPAQGARLDRDVVIRWPVAAIAPGVSLSVGRDGDDLVGRIVVVPPATPQHAVGRDVILLLDISGSMSGHPLAQLVATSEAIVQTLTTADTLEIVTFGGHVRRWAPTPTPVTPHARSAAVAWLRHLRACGGTPMDEGIRAALAGVREDAQRQVLLLTDGHIGFEDRIIDLVRTCLPPGSRLHAVGVGDSVNRGLLLRAARVGGGVDLILGLRDDVARITRELLPRLVGPQIVDLQVAGDAVVARAQDVGVDVFAGCPACLHLRLKPGRLTLSGRTARGSWTHTLDVPDTQQAAPAVGRMFARDAVLWQELGPASAARDAAVTAIGLRWGIVTSQTALIGVSDAAVVDASLPTTTLHVAHDQPHGVSVEALGLRPVTAPFAAHAGAPPDIMTYAAAPDVSPSVLRSELRGGAPPRHPSPPAPKVAGLTDALRRAASGVASKLRGGPEVTQRAWAPHDLRSCQALSDRTLLTFTTSAARSWLLPDKVTVRDATGAEREVDVLPGSTATCELPPSASYRLILRALDITAVLIDGAWYPTPS